ncbi:MAG: ABC transporter permease, partial [Pseudomonadota bacterium]
MRLINQKLSRPVGLFLAAIPFLFAIVVYVIASDMRLSINPSDKLLPSLNSLADAFWNMAFVPSRRTGELLLWTDTLASLYRLGSGIGIAALLAVIIGVPLGFIPAVRTALGSFVATISLV